MAVRKWAATAFVATILTAGTILGLAGPAAADVPIGGFSTQAQRAGLTAAQAEQLQARADVAASLSDPGTWPSQPTG
jgi:hypothetical protein